MSNLELLKQGYKDFAAGNVEAVLASWQPDIVWDESTGFPFIEGNGIFVGGQAIVENIFSRIPEYYEDFKIEIDHFIDGGDKIAMVGHYTGTWKPTGKKFKVNAINAWTFVDGKASKFFQAADTASIINP